MFIMDRLASQTAASTAGGVSLVTWAGIDAVNQDAATMAGFLMMSVPVLALMVMRGTLSVAHNMGALLSPAQGAADAAAVERTTGNYAFGDVSYGNLNAENRQMAQWNLAPNLMAGAPQASLRGEDGRMYRTYGDANSVIDASGAISQLPFKATMTRGYASDLRNQGQWYLNEADRIENGTSTTWSSSRGRFGSEVAASSQVTGSRNESGSRASDTHNVGGNVLIEGSSGKSTREVTNDDLILRQGNNRSSGNFDQRAFGTSATLSANGSIGTPGKDIAGSGVSTGLGASIFGRREWGDDARAGTERSATNQGSLHESEFYVR